MKTEQGSSKAEFKGQSKNGTRQQTRCKGTMQGKSLKQSEKSINGDSESGKQNGGKLLVKCEEAMRRQDIGEMYSILKQLGLRDYAVPNSKATVIPAETFKKHFQKVQEKRE